MLCVLTVIFIFITLIRAVLSLLRKQCNLRLIEKGQSATVCAYKNALQLADFLI